jgi:hypothetical protein
MDKPRACLPAITFAVLFFCTAFALGAGAAVLLAGRVYVLASVLSLFADQSIVVGRGFGLGEEAAFFSFLPAP